MNLLKHPSELKVGAPGVDKVINLVGVMVHIHPTIRALHSVSLSHGLLPQCDVVPSVSQDFRHPDQLVQELVDAPDV